MWSPRQALATVFLCLLAASLLFGCRAFEPEAADVNRPPETYIIGAPAETSGAYFHFRVFWYGTDADGFVERYVWALTDTSTQNIDTDDDEEDERFNPATNASTLEIGTYTTRTDTVFDFRIGQGAGLVYDMTLHMVAIDNEGLFDRTPARLHFFSNALGNPQVEFYRVLEDGEVRFFDNDTLAYGRPLRLRWGGRTPNLNAYDPALLAERDTVPPFDDGLLGFKWRMPGEDDCNPAERDCYNPKELNEATGDSFSVFADVTEMVFRNDGSGSSVFGRRLDAGFLRLLVNTIDVAGVQVPLSNQLLNIKVNHDPDTYILDGEQDWVAAHNDPTTYPTFTVFHGPLAGTYSFTSGDTVPDRSYVTFKAMGWDDRRDQRVDEDVNGMSFQGRFLAGQNAFVDGVYFPFETTYSFPHSTGDWLAEDPADPQQASSDTVGFQVGPFNYEVQMRAVDEHGTPDGTPATLSFVGNYPPCVQCIELGSIGMEASAVYDNIVADNCYDGDCLDTVTELEVFTLGAPGFDAANPNHLGGSTPGNARQGKVWLNETADIIRFDEPVSGNWVELDSWEVDMMVYLHGKDHPMEHWPDGQAQERIKAWRYQIDYAGDPNNAIADGGGRDDIRLLSGYNIDSNPPEGLFINPVTGVWEIKVTVSMGQALFFQGPDAYWTSLCNEFNCPPRPDGGSVEEIEAWQADPQVSLARKAWNLTMAQFTPGTVRAIAIDQSTCEFRRTTNTYHYYEGTRVPTPNGRECRAGAYNQDPPDGEVGGIYARGAINLDRFAAYSNDREPVVKEFDITLRLPTGPYQVGDPPGWIGGKHAGLSLR